MTSALRNIFVSGFFAAALAACGGGGGGGSSTPAEAPTPTPPTTTPPPPPVSDVTLDQLAGTWFGMFDSTSDPMNAIEIDIDKNGNITDLKLDNATTNLTGTITKAATDEGQRLFRFVLKEKADPSKPFNQGTLMVDPTGTHLFYIDEFSQAAVLQAAAIAPSATFAQADINGSWKGDSMKTTGVSRSNTTPPGNGFGKFTQGNPTATCQPAAASAPSGPSSCTITVGSITRTAASLVLNSSAGDRWTGNYTETPDVAGSDKAINMYVSPDKKFAGGYTCATAGDFSSCNFYRLPKQ